MKVWPRAEKSSRKFFRSLVSGLWTPQGTGLWKRCCSQGSLVPQVTRGKWEEKLYSKEKKKRQSCFLGDPTKSGGLHEICIWFLLRQKSWKFPLKKWRAPQCSEKTDFSIGRNDLLLPVPTAGKQPHSPFLSPQRGFKASSEPFCKNWSKQSPRYYSAQAVEIGPPQRQRRLYQQLSKPGEQLLDEFTSLT